MPRNAHIVAPGVPDCPPMCHSIGFASHEIEEAYDNLNPFDRAE